MAALFVQNQDAVLSGFEEPAVARLGCFQCVLHALSFIVKLSLAQHPFNGGDEARQLPFLDIIVRARLDKRHGQIQIDLAGNDNEGNTRA